MFDVFPLRYVPRDCVGPDYERKDNGRIRILAIRKRAFRHWDAYRRGSGSGCHQI